LPDVVKVLFLIVGAGWKLLNHFQVTHWVKAYNMTFNAVFRALTVHGAKSGGGAGGGGGKGAMMGMMKIIPWLLIIGTVVSVGMGIFSMFGKKKGDGGSGEGVDVSGQLGKRYGMSQASQLGTTLNAELSKNVQALGDGLMPIVEHIQVTAEKMTTPLEDALGRTATGMDQTVDLYKGTAGKVSDKVQAWLDESRKKNRPTSLEPELPWNSGPSGYGGRRTNVDGSDYTGRDMDGPSTAIKNAAREWVNEQRKMTDLQKANAQQAAQMAIEEGARAEERHNIWLSKQGIREGDY
jgi:hypothetical protein